MSNSDGAYSIAGVSANVRAEVARAGASQTDIAAVLGLSQAGVSRRLSGRVDFSATELTKLAAYLKVPASAFFESRGTAA